MSDGRSRMTPAVFFSGLMMVFGVLIAIGSGLCSVGLSIAGLASTRSSTEMWELLTMGVPIVGIVGGIPFGVGLVLFFAGRAWSRRATSDGPPPPSWPPDYGNPNTR
ncbi:MAG: hypothetical protein U1E70_19750 [Acetobacteraceae bacterium]|nr:hypothetical protein [Pseudomonadota bacterium]